MVVLRLTERDEDFQNKSIPPTPAGMSWVKMACRSLPRCRGRQQEAIIIIMILHSFISHYHHHFPFSPHFHFLKIILFVQNEIRDAAFLTFTHVSRKVHRPFKKWEAESTEGNRILHTDNAVQCTAVGVYNIHIYRRNYIICRGKRFVDLCCFFIADSAASCRWCTDL